MIAKADGPGHVRRALWSCALVLLVLYASAYVWPEGAPGVAAFMVVHTLAFLVVGWLVWRIRQDPWSWGGSTTLPLIIGFAVLFRAVLVPLAPVASDDLFRYVWDGRVQAHGIDPYRFAPADAALRSLATADLPARVYAPEMVTIYPPLAQWTFVLARALSGEQVWGLKLLLVAADLGTVLLLVSILTVRRMPPVYALLYAWSPLPVLYIALDGHVDAIAVLGLVAAVRLWPASWLGAATALGAAALAKLFPLALLPVFGRDAGWRRGIPFAAVVTTLFALAWLPYREGLVGAAGALTTFATQFSFNGPLFVLLNALLDSSSLARVLCLAAAGSAVVAISTTRLPLPGRLQWGLTAMLVCSPVAHPWYFCAVAAMTVLHWSRPVFVLIGLTVLSNVTVYRYRAGEPWTDVGIVLALEFLPVAVLLAGEWRAARRASWTSGACATTGR